MTGMIYEKLDKEFRRNEEITNLNGTSYKVVGIFKPGTLFLQNLKNDNFMVAVGTKLFKRYPRSVGPDSNKTEIGVEWEHGDYLGNDITKIDMLELSRTYAAKEFYKTMDDFYESFEQKFRDHKIILEKYDVSEEIKEKVKHEMYEIFETISEHEFREKLRDGLYDYVYFNEMKCVSDREKEKQCYKVTITETLERVVEVDAVSMEDALENVRGQYYNQDIVLDAEDLTSADFTGKQIAKEISNEILSEYSNEFIKENNVRTR